jgi:hypothetical protein
MWHYRGHMLYQLQSHQSRRLSFCMLKKTSHT